MSRVRLLSDGKRLPLVYGSGFEDRPDVLRAVARRVALAGCAPDTIERLADPLGFAALAARLGIPVPPVRPDPPRDPSGWLVKRAGGSGGGHVRPARRSNTPSPTRYWQRRAEGRSISLQFVADWARLHLLAECRQWHAPRTGRPFRFGGLAIDTSLGASTLRQMTLILERLVAPLGLLGLISADLVVADDGWRLIEVNVRPGAALALLDDAGGSALDLHLRAASGETVEVGPPTIAARALGILYADRPIAHVPDIDWPDWTSDRPAPGSHIASGDPVATVHATADDADRAQRLIETRTERLKALFRERRDGERRARQRQRQRQPPREAARG